MKPISVIAISFFFSAWGDRLWNFAVGLYLVKLTPDSLQLAAIYGLVLTASSILFSPVVGDRIDHSNRLKAVRILLVLQNVFVIFCALCILLYLYRITSDHRVLMVMQGLIILLGSMANLAGVGEKISITKDWVVVICRLDKDMLANANALLRRIDLSVAILAPVGVGLLMTVVSDLAGIIFICSWNVLTVFAEYFLLLHVYRNDPDLPQKANVDVREDVIVNNTGNDSLGENAVSMRSFKTPSTNLNFLHRFKAIVSGWKVYHRQQVFLAGFALAWLYLTVLGFNAITTSYAYSQGLKEVYVSICFGLGSLLGIAGTYLFPLIRNRIGLPKTGLVGNILQVSMLSMCVVSIWLPGSPSSLTNNQHSKRLNNTVTPARNLTRLHSYKVQSISLDIQGSPANVTTEADDEINNISILVFMAGIILSRSGLWIADLTITQLQQENVPEEERGTVGGVQYAFNSFFDLLHYVVTICLPYPKQFWILIFMSVFAVLSSSLTYIVFIILSKIEH